MALEFLPQHWSAILCIAIMIGAIIVSYLRKNMLTFSLIFANVAIFIITLIYPNEIIGGLGFRPIYLESEYITKSYTLFTSMFIHGGFFHIFGNMVILLLIGYQFEQRVGWKKFLVIYLVTGVCGALAHAMYVMFTHTYPWELQISLVGASGAIFGIMGAFAMSYPRDKVLVPIGIGIAFLMRVRVMYAVAFYAIIETFIVWLDVPDGTAHFAHLGGLIGGMILAYILIRGRPTHTKKGETIYYDTYMDQKLRKIDMSVLKKLADTPELKEILKKIENETVPQVRDTWLEYFMDKAVCPKCGNHMSHFDGKIWCDKCGFKDRY